MAEIFSNETVVPPVVPHEYSSDTIAAAPAEVPDQSPEHFRFLDLKQQLQTLRRQGQAAVERVSEYLHRLRTSAHESSKTDEVAKELTTALQDISLRQDSLESLFRESMREGVTTHSAESSFIESENLPVSAMQFQSAVLDRLEGIETQLQTQNERLESTLAPADQSACDAEFTVDNRGNESASAVRLSSPNVMPNESGRAWLRNLLGPELCDDERLTASVNWLELSVLSNNDDALMLIGQLLVFRFSSSDRKPPLLQDVGEAFYRCFPKSRDDQNLFEEILAAWLQRQCEASGLPNTIELVHLGERFDSSKHAPLERGGVEIVAVLGWVVLRDGGRIFSKAAVQTC